MTKGYSFIVNLIALVAIVGLVMSGYFIYQNLAIPDADIANQLDVNTIIICASILLGALVMRSGTRNTNRSVQPVYQEKYSTYKRFIDYFYTGLPLDDGWHELTSAMTMWASDSVLRQYLQLIRMLEEKQDIDALQKKAEKVVLEIRRDLGNTNLGILKGDIIKTEKRFESYESKKKTQKTASI